MCSNLHSFDVYLSRTFRHLGRCIGRHPGYFVAIPVLAFGLALSGYRRFDFVSDPEYLFSPVDGPSKHEKSVQQEFFPTNHSAFDPGRMAEVGCMGRVIVRARDGDTLLKEDVLDDIAALDRVINSLSVPHKRRRWKFTDLCSTLHGECFPNNLLLIAKHGRDLESGSLELTYPIWFDPDSFRRVDFPFFTGGVNVSEDNTILGIDVMALNYFLKSDSEEDKLLGHMWEEEFLSVLSQTSFENITVARFASITLEREMDANTNSIMPYFALNVGVMIVFCVASSMMADWVRSKPLLGIFGVVSAILGTTSSFGLCAYLGISFIGINLAILFLMLGIGIDDTFIMLSAWRRSSHLDSVPDRMARCYESAAVSITITSLTDALSFWIGMLAPFPSVKIFCAYSGFAVLCTYLWHLTFFGGLLAVLGYAEEQNRHAVTFQVVLPKSLSDKKSRLYRLFCQGGVDPRFPANPADNSSNAIMSFFRDRVGGALGLVRVKALVMGLFAVYLVVSLVGLTQLEEGLERKRLARYDSYSAVFFDLEDSYFRDYPYRISVVVQGNLSYSNATTQTQVEDLLTRLERSRFIDPTYTESWLRDFLAYGKALEMDLSTERKFVDALKTYVESDYNLFKQDVLFDGDRIVATRYLIQANDVRDAVDERLLVQELRGVCGDYPLLEATAFHPYFVYFDQFLQVLPTTVQCVCIAAAVMVAVSLLLIPSAICALWVALSIVSIEVGVLGLMALWGVALDSISMVNLIMCIGFSVDFSAHIAHHFASSDASTEDRISDSLFALGLPITQGAASTVVGVLGLALTPSYVFVTFFKMIFLVVFLGALHGLFILPVILSLVGPDTKFCAKRNKQ